MRLMTKIIILGTKINILGTYVPVAPDMAKTVKVKSDRSENSARVFDIAINGHFNSKSDNNFYRSCQIN